MERNIEKIGGNKRKKGQMLENMEEEILAGN